MKLLNGTARRFTAVLTIAILTGWIAGHALAGEVILKNGDRLTGKLTASAVGDLKIESDALGEVKVDMKDVRTFSSDEPVELRLTDGSVIKESITVGDEGTVRTAGPAGRVVQLSSIDKINPPAVKWTGAISLAGALASGNTKSIGLTLDASAVRRTDDDRITLGAGYRFQRERDPGTGTNSETQNRYFINAKYDYFLTKKFYVFGNVGVEHDAIANLDLRLTPGLGVGYQWLETAKMNFNTEAGLTYVYEKYAGVSGSNEYLSLRLAYHFDWKLLDEKVLLFHNLEYLPSLEDISDYLINTDIGVRTMMTSAWFTQFKVALIYDSTPAPGKTEADLQFLLGVGYAF